MKKLKKALCITLAGIMTLSVCACNKDGQSVNNGSNAGGDTDAAKQYVYAYEDIDLGVDMNNVGLYDMTYRDGKIYAIIEDYSNSMGNSVEPRSAVALPELDDDFAVDVPAVEEDVTTEEDAIEGDVDLGVDNDMSVGIEDIYYGPNYYLLSAKVDGSDKGAIKLELSEMLTQAQGYVSGIYLLEDGSVAAIFEEYYEDTTDPNNIVFMQRFYVMKWDNEGKLLWTTDMTTDDGSYLYAQSINVDEAGNLTIISGENQIIRVDAQGKETERTQIESSDMGYTSQIFAKEDGNLQIISYNDDWTKMYISEYNMTTNQMEEKIELPGNMSGYNIYEGTSTDLLLSNSFGMYTYNIGDAEPTKVMDYINSDLATYGLYNIHFIDDNTFVAKYYDSINYTDTVAKFTYVDPKDIPDKTSFVLGCNYLGSDVKRRVIDFNKTNSKYRITIKDYSAYNTVDDYTLSTTQMNNDIISGKMPDIMVIDASQDISSWANKGLLADVGELIAKDEELSKVEFLQNVWDAFSVNGKLYTVVSGFNVQTMTARRDVVGDRTQWTMPEFVEFMKTQGEDVKPFGDDMVRSNVLYYVMTYCGSDFVDVNSGKCNFDSEEFISMLEYANTFPEEFSEDYWEDYDWESTQGLYRDKKAVLLHTYISQIQDLVYTLHGTLGDEAVFVGYPGISGNSSVMYPSSNMFVLSAKSKNLDGAWEFVRYYLTDEYQSSDEFYGLPVSKTAFEEKAQKATEKPYWLDENGEKVEYDNTYYINGEEIVLDPFTQEELDKICEFIYSVNKRSYYNMDINNIVFEEAESFFSGQKSAKEVAGIIQSRVQIYVDENR